MAPTTTYPPPLAEPEHRRQRLKVGAVCGKAAHTDLCGGCEVTRIPTATKAPAKLARSAGVSPAQVRPSKPPGSECCVRRRRRRTRSVHSGCVGCGSEPRNDEFAGAETVVMVERNMCNADMRGIDVLPGSKSTSRANGSRWNLGYRTSGRQLFASASRIGKARSRSR